MPVPIRLAKRVVEILGCSRGDADRYIEGGWVSVDGRMVEEPQYPVTSANRVEIAADAQLQASEPATLLLHKPAGVDFATTAALATPATRAAEDADGERMFKRHFARLEPLMHLDTEASGLIVLSQDGRVRRRLTEDADSIEQELVVEVTGTLPIYGLGQLSRGMSYQGRLLPPAKISWQSETRLRFAIKAVRPGQIRHMCQKVGLEVVAIRRIRIGRIPLSKLPVGAWRHLPAGERF